MNMAAGRVSVTSPLFCSLVQADIMTWPMWTLATAPWLFPEALHTPAWSLSDPISSSVDNVLWIQVMWMGWSCTQIREPSLHSFSPGTCQHKYEQPPGLQWELSQFHLLPPQVKDVDRSIRDTSAEARLCIQLVLTIPIPILVMSGWVAAHGDTRIFNSESKICWEALRLAAVHWELNTWEFLPAMGNV